MRYWRGMSSRTGAAPHGMQRSPHTPSVAVPRQQLRQTPQAALPTPPSSHSRSARQRQAKQHRCYCRWRGTSAADALQAISLRYQQQRRQWSLQAATGMEEFTASVDGSVDEDLDSLAVVEEADGHRGHASSAASVKLLGIEGGKYTVEGRMDSRVSPDTVFGLLVDYERVVDIFSNVLRSSTYRCAGADTRLQQVCRWEFLVFSGKFPLELTVAERPQQRQVVFSLDSSPFMDSFQGSWQVTPRAGGGSHIHHVMAVTPKLAPPRPLAFYTRRIFERQVAAILEDLAAALEKAC